MGNELGAIYTPPDIANLLANWAIRSNNDKVLDLGIGEGVFVYACYEKLLASGADAQQAAEQIYGSEIDEASFNTFRAKAGSKGLNFPNLICQDFFQSEFPQVDAIIGNPPYVNRKRIPIETLEQTRRSVVAMNPDVDEQALSHLADLYVYFLLRAFPLLKPEGKVAIIAADSWLNVRYGRILKQYLKNQFEIKRIISFDRSIFPNALVKPILLFATKKQAPSPDFQVAFTRVMNGLAVNALSKLFQKPEPSLVDVSTRYVPVADLDENAPWGIHFKISEINELLEDTDWLVPIKKIAGTRIGLQTLAKDFFVLTPEDAQTASIETEFLEPFAYSIAQFSDLIIDKDTDAGLNLFFCARPKQDLEGTQALKYILSGERRKVQIRGKDQTVIGYHNKERIKKAHRPYWYDLKTEVNKRGRAQVLIPRLIYKDYRVLWNRVGLVPGEGVIEFIPNNKNINLQLYLAVLNSTLMEVLIRGYAQMYGGGACTVGLSQIKATPIIDIPRLGDNAKNDLLKAYQTFRESNNRQKIDDVIWSILGVDGSLFEATVEDLRMMTVSARKKSA